MSLLLPALARSVVGLCFKIHDEGGIYLSDFDYIESVKYELDIRGLGYFQNQIIDLEYLGKLIDRHIVEFIIGSKVLLDLKGKIMLKHPNYYKQLTSYLVKENLPLAFIVDFHTRKLEIRRVVNPNFNYQFR
jgi:GxxExxY protein